MRVANARASCRCIVSAGAERDADALVFEPASGLLHVGSSVEIHCRLNGTSDASGGWFALTGGHSSSDLVSTQVGQSGAWIGPPAGHETYPKHGTTAVSCSYEHRTGQQVRRNLTVRILRECGQCLFSVGYVSVWFSMRLA